MVVVLNIAVHRKEQSPLLFYAIKRNISGDFVSRDKMEGKRGLMHREGARRRGDLQRGGGGQGHYS